MTSELRELLPYLTVPERAELNTLLRGQSTWRPQPGPQTLAYHSQADILFYGGAAHGGKTDLLLGLARNEHRRSILFRRVGPSLQSMIERSRAIYAPDAESAEVNRLNEQRLRWRLIDGRIVQFGHLQSEEDVKKHQGQSRDLYGFDELPEFSEAQFRFVTGWNRTTVEGQRCRIVGTGNPPTDSDGEWVIRYFAPWLDENHPNRARPGELRWFTTGNDGKDVEVPNGDPVLVDGPRGPMLVRPKSRTFIPALPTDNAYTGTDYIATLQAMPEPLRSKMLFGDFAAGREDNAYQVIPSEWVRLAQARWTADGSAGVPLDAIGVDVARGGKDKTLIARRHRNWIAPLRRHPGSSTPDGGKVASLVVAERGSSDAIVNIDVIGVGSSPYDALRNGWVDEQGEKRPGIGIRAVPMNGAEKSEKRDKSGKLGFVNQRAEWYWTAREALDPASGQDLALPPDDELRADLCAARWKPTPRGIQIEAKDEIIKRIGRSPDAGDAVVNALVIKQTPGQGFLELMEQDIAAQAAAKAKEQT
jgi:hypothetical protein